MSVCNVGTPSAGRLSRGFGRLGSCSPLARPRSRRDGFGRDTDVPGCFHFRDAYRARFLFRCRDPSEKHRLGAVQGGRRGGADGLSPVAVASPDQRVGGLHQARPNLATKCATHSGIKVDGLRVSGE